MCSPGLNSPAEFFRICFTDICYFLLLQALSHSESMVSFSHRTLVNHIRDDNIHAFQGFLENKRSVVDDRDEVSTFFILFFLNLFFGIMFIFLVFYIQP